jgi:hypothetical protein
MLQKTGGTFTLSAEVDFGGAYGIKTLYLKSQTANPAAAGVVRLAKTDTINFRNEANDGDLALGRNSSDQLTYNGNPIIGSAALTADRALQSSSTGVVEASAVTATELGYVSGVTSAIQTQLNAKALDSDLTNHISDTSTHGITSAIVGLSETQSLSNKTFSDPITLAEVATPSTPASGFMKLYPKSDNKLYYLNDGGTETEVGAGGSSGINYITNPNAETDVSGWATYADAAAATPADGTGGSPTTTWTRSTSSPLRGTANFLLTKDAANRRGEGVSYDFTIAAADAAKIIRISFDYKSSSAFADGDVRVYIYDVTNAQLIEPTARDLAANTVNGTYISEFQTNSNSTSYRLILHVASVNASAYTVQMDNFNVGPREIARGSVVTDWKAYTPSTSATNTTYTAKWRRVGDSMEVRVRFEWTGTPSAWNAIAIPTGYVIDASKISSPAQYKSALGYGMINNNSAAAQPLWVTYYDTTQVSIVYEAATTNQIGPVTTSTPYTLDNGDTCEVFFMVPIAGWSSNANISSDFGGRLISLEVGRVSTSQAITASVDTKLLFNSTTGNVDTVAGWSSANSEYTIQESGEYEINPQLSFNGIGAAGDSDIRIKVGPSSVRTQIWSYPSFAASGTSPRFKLSLVRGDVISVWMTSSQNMNLLSSATIAGGSRLSIKKLATPQTLMGGEVVAARAHNMTTLITTAGASLVFATKQYDTHGAYNAATGEFTCPYAGKFGIGFNFTANTSPTGSASSFTTFFLYKNGTEDHLITSCIRQISGALSPRASGYTEINCSAGDVLKVFALRDAGDSADFTSSGTDNTWVFFRKVN